MLFDIHFALLNHNFRILSLKKFFRFLCRFLRHLCCAILLNLRHYWLDKQYYCNYHNNEYCKCNSKSHPFLNNIFIIHKSRPPFSMSLIKNVLLYLPQLYNTKLTSSLHSHIIYICTCQSHDNLLNYTGRCYRSNLCRTCSNL